MEAWKRRETRYAPHETTRRVAMRLPMKPVTPPTAKKAAIPAGAAGERFHQRTEIGENHERAGGLQGSDGEE